MRRPSPLALRLAGTLLLAALLLAPHAGRRQLALSCLLAYQCWLGLSLGSVGLLLLHAVSGGAWGDWLRPALLAAVRPWPLLLLATVPMLALVPWLYPWAMPAPDAATAAALARQRWYLDLPGFAVRELLLALLWWRLAAWLQRPGRLPRRIAVVALLAYLLGASLCGVDWVMSLQPAWHSSALGLSYLALQVLAATALAVWRSAGQRAVPLDGGELGFGLLALLLFCAYLLFMDYLTAWSADQPAEVAWYAPRTLTSWHWLALFDVLAGLVAPMALLLPARGKRRASPLRFAAALLLAACLGQLAWWLLPAARPAGFAMTAGDALAVLGLGAWWCSFGMVPARRPAILSREVP
jgi:hypothetical protein